MNQNINFYVSSCLEDNESSTIINLSRPAAYRFESAVVQIIGYNWPMVIMTCKYDRCRFLSGSTNQYCLYSTVIANMTLSKVHESQLGYVANFLVIGQVSVGHS